jgi:hypothetical protein
MKQQHRFSNGIAALLATASGMTGVPDAKGADGVNDARSFELTMRSTGGERCRSSAKSDTSESAPGDRHPSINQVYPPEAFYHAGRGGRILDVTKPPFNAKATASPTTPRR